MNFVKLIGDWLTGSGWFTALTQAEVTTSGRADAILKCSHLTRACYAHQITVASLSILQKTAYDDYANSNLQPLEFEEWCKQEAEQHPQFKYWSMTLDLELLLLQFVYSLQTGDFRLYISTLQEILPWLFAMDHTNCARWLPVHLRDMIFLESRHPSLYQQFLNKNFVIQKSPRVFSTIGIDEAHEQLNEIVKGRAGTVGLFDSPQALQRWMLAGPEVVRMTGEYEDQFCPQLSKEMIRHHEMNPSIQKQFRNDVEALVSALSEMGNPFADDTKDLFTLDTKAVMDASATDLLTRVKDIGSTQYQKFVEERLKSPNNALLSNTISKNGCTIFKTPSVKVQKKSDKKVLCLKSDCSLFSRLYITCQTRAGDLDNVFAHENQATPPALSDMGQLRQGNKSDLVEILERGIVHNGDVWETSFSPDGSGDNSPNW